MVVREQWARLRERVAAQGISKTAQYLMFTVIGERAGLEVNAAFQFREDNSTTADTGCAFEVVTEFAGFRDDDLEHLREYGGEALMQRFAVGFRDNELCVIGRVDGQLAAICWVVPQESYGGALTEQSVTVERCFTLPQYRGRGLFPASLNFIRQHLSQTHKTRVFIEASIFNQASVRGITKSGCQRVGTKVSWHGREAFIPNASPRTRN